MYKRQAAVVHGGDDRAMGPLSAIPEAAAWWPAVDAATAALLRAAGDRVWERAAPHADYWALLGLDFLPDADGRVWLLEANTGPRLWLKDEPGASPSAALDAVDARVTRPLLLDTVDLLARLRLGRDDVDAANAWRPLDG